MNDRLSLAQIRLSEAIEELDQANTIFAYVFLVLDGFEGFGDPKWDHRLNALVNVSNLIGPIPNDDFESSRVIAKASQEIAQKRLPRQLCIALVSAIETALEDLTKILLSDSETELDDDAIEKKVLKLMRGGPANYLPALADAIGISFFHHEAWEDFRELVASRNLLVHRVGLIADAKYVLQAGKKAKVTEGEELEIDNAYLTQMYMLMKVLMIDLLQVVLGHPTIHHK